MRTLTIVLAAMALGGCGNSAVENAHKAVAYQLMDPESAKFREDQVLADGSVCGQVNGKNAYGAYSGYNHYVARKAPTGFDVLIDLQGNNPQAAKLCGYPLAVVPVVAPAATHAVNEIAGVKWSVQLASTSSPETARILSNKLAGYGFTPYVAREEGVSRVLVGPYDSRTVATQKLDELRHAHKLRGVLVRYRGVGDLPSAQTPG
ncbi:MAG: SPOR domain-containing protein [Pseudomonas sp.]|uniref:SPOR domain-containing protein n=1 Tax=Pseudomonas abieticivorans TaxID=2931382 RepID=UPI0020C12A71|nr:SPOR domain-containing protein [Pseudomonas sp. PIA16]MDE1166266.1 SPOR domain-containing protein [Pseudomonas sp.]